MAAKNILSQLNIVKVAALTDSGTAFIGFGAKADGLYLKNGAAAELRLLTAGDVGVNVAAYGHSHSGYQTALSGSGFVKISGTTISYDPTTYLSTKANVEAVLTGQISSHYHDLSGYATIGHTHTGVYQSLDADLTAIAALAGTSGILKKTAANTWALDTTSYVSGTPWTGMGYVTGTPWTAMGYLTSQISHADVLVDGDFASQGIMLRGATSGVYSILADNSASWNTAFGWGNHAGLYSLLAHTHSGYQPTLSGTGFVKSTAGVISYDTNTYVTGTPWTGMGYVTGTPWTAMGYLTSQTSHADVLVDGDFASQGIMLRGATSGSYSILADNSANWNTAFGWGNHSGLYSLLAHTHSGYQATLSGTGLVKSTAGVISYDTNTYVTGTPWTGMGYVTGTPWTVMGYLTSQTSHADVLVDGDFASQGIMLRGATSGSYSILADNSASWNTAFGWGNHSGLYSLLTHTHSGYQSALSGTGFVKSTAGVISYDTNTYVTGTPWTGMGYLTSQISHADVVVDGDFASQGIMLRGATSGSYSILADNSANWNTAFGWGNHSGLYSLLAHTHSGYQATLSGTGLVKSTAGVISYDTNTYVTGTPWTGMGYLTSQTSHADVLVDGDFASQGIMLRGATSGSYSILADNSASWNTAFGWGNHAGLYSLLAHTHSGYQPALSGTGFVKSTAGVISYDTNSYVTGTPWTGMGYVTGTPWTAMGYLTAMVYPSAGIPVSTGTGWSSTVWGVDYGCTSGENYKLSTSGGIYAFVNNGYQAKHTNLSSLSGLSYSSSAIVRMTGTGAFSLDTTSYVSGTPWTSMGYLTGITKSQVEAVLTGTITSHTHNYNPVITLTTNGTSGAATFNGTTLNIPQYSGSTYTLPAAGVGSLGGIKLGFSATGAAVPLQSSSDMGFVTITKAAIEVNFTGLITSHTHSYAPINGSSSNAFSTANLSVTGTINASSTITGSEVYRGSSRALKKNIADFDFDAIGFLNEVSIKQYNLKSNNSFGIGFIAEDTHSWLSGDNQKSHVFGNHLGLLTKAIQQEDKKVEVIKLEVLELQARVRELEIARANGWR